MSARMVRFVARGCREAALSWVPSKLGMVIRVDDYGSPEFWAEIAVPLETLRAWVRLCEQAPDRQLDDDQGGAGEAGGEGGGS